MIIYEKVPYFVEYNEEMYKGRIESIAQSDPRVILFFGEGAYGLLCWLHRYKIFGPNYALFMFNYADVNSYNVYFPEHYYFYNISVISGWCTNDMVRQVLDTSFLFGEANRASLFENVPDSVGTTAAAMDLELYSRFRGIERVFALDTMKYFYYDSLLFIGFMLNEAERILRERNDSLINWSVKGKHFRNDGLQIAKVFQNAVNNVTVVGLRGSYQFQSNTSGNTGGYTPLSLVQLQSFPDNFSVKHHLVAWYGSSKPIHERLTVNEQLIRWNTEDGRHPFDRVQIKKVTTTNLTWSSVIPLMAISFIVNLTLAIVTLRNRSNRTFSNFFLLIGVLICNTHVYIMHLRNVEPIAFHCSILASLIMIGTGTIILANWSILNYQLQTGLQTWKAIKYGKMSVCETQGNKMEMSKFQKVFVLLTFLAILALGILFIFSSAIVSFRSEATYANTFGKREIVLSTVKHCKLNLDIFPIIVLATYTAILLLLVFRSGFLAFAIRVCKKQMRQVRNSNLIGSVGKDSGNFFIVFVTVITCSFAILAMVPQQDFIITAVMTIVLGLNSIFMVHLR